MRKAGVGLTLLLLAALAWLIKESLEAPAKVVLISLDGAADGLVDDYLERGVLPADGALAHLARTGARAEAMLPVTPSMTATAHVTLFTGAYPERHSIVSNNYHVVGDPITRSTSGYAAPIQAETLWQAARRQGKRVLCVAAVGADGSSPERSCDRTLGYGVRVGRAAVVELRGDAREKAAGENSEFEHLRRLTPTTDSPGQPVFDFNRSEDVPVEVWAADTVADGSEHYDTLLLDFDQDLSNGFAARLAAGEWAAVELPSVPNAGAAKVGAWVKALELADDLSRVRVYLGAPHHNRGAPADYVAALETELGFWPGGPDDFHRSRELLDLESWREQAERLSDYLRDATLLSMRRTEWDLVVTYQPLVDEVEHPFFLRHPRQPNYGDEGRAKRARYAGHVEWGYQTVDKVLSRLIEAAPKEANLVVVSDHGMVPVHTRVAVNALLARAGLRVTEDERSEVRAFTSGATAHIRVNLAGRESNGVVPPEKLEEYVERIVAACEGLRDPVTGAPIFERVLRNSELGEVHLGHPRAAGDVWVNARPGYALSGRIESLALRARDKPLAPVLEPAATLRGQHGYLGTNQEVQAIFFAGGPKVKPGGIGTVHHVDVAPTVSALLGIDPPAQNQGRNVLVGER